MKLVIIESPYTGKNPEEIDRNVAYARRAMADSLKRGEAPFLSHLLYTQVLDDMVSEQRRGGIEAGLAWGQKADMTAVYMDHGISQGMAIGIKRAIDCGRMIDLRYIGAEKVTSG